MARRGGKRPGAGRKPGKKDKPKIVDSFTEKDKEELIEHLKKRALESDKVAIFLAEQIYGKAPQKLIGGDEDDAPISVDITVSLNKIYGA